MFHNFVHLSKCVRILCAREPREECVSFHSFACTWVSARGSLQSVHQTVFVAKIFLGPESLCIYVY
jgi:hypothetical protein